MSELTLERAQKIVNDSIAYGRDKNLLRLAVAVLDERGALKAFGAEQGTSGSRATC